MVLDQALVHRVADRLLTEGVRPEPNEIARQMGIAPDEPELLEALQGWWDSLAGRVTVLEPAAEQAPDALQRAIRILWQDAVREAARQVNNERQSLDHSLEALRRESQTVLSGSRADYETLEHRYAAESLRAEESAAQVKLLEAEISVLKANLSGEVVQRKQYEEKLADYKSELRRGEKQIEEARKSFDQRLKDEQAHGQEQLAKSEAELAQLRRTLDQAREQSGKKDAALTRNVHDLQTEVVKREVKLETQHGQIKSLEAELKTLRSENALQKREIGKLNAALLSETNQNKRHDEKLRKLEAALKKEQQRSTQLGSEANRKELELRNQLKARDEELFRVKASLQSAQKRQLTQEEAIRRLTQQVGA